MINPQWLELPMSRIHLHGPKGSSRNWEVRLYFFFCFNYKKTYKYIRTNTVSDSTRFTDGINFHCPKNIRAIEVRQNWPLSMQSAYAIPMGFLQISLDLGIKSLGQYNHKGNKVKRRTDFRYFCHLDREKKHHNTTRWWSSGKRLAWLRDRA